MVRNRKWVAWVSSRKGGYVLNNLLSSFIDWKLKKLELLLKLKKKEFTSSSQILEQELKLKLKIKFSFRFLPREKMAPELDWRYPKILLKLTVVIWLLKMEKIKRNLRFVYWSNYFCSTKFRKVFHEVSQRNLNNML